MELILPDLKFKDSFLRMARELARDGHWYDDDPSQLESMFVSYLLSLQNSRFAPLPGEVCFTEYWMMHDDQIVGRLRLYHALTESQKIRGGHIGYGVAPIYRKKGFAKNALGQALVKAREIGLTEVLITCDETNFPSQKIIVGHGGHLRDKIFAPGRTILTLRYTIDLKAENRIRE